MLNFLGYINGVFQSDSRASPILSKINLSFLMEEPRFFPAKLIILTPSSKMILVRHAFQQMKNADLHLAFLQNIFTNISAGFFFPEDSCRS